MITKIVELNVMCHHPEASKYSIVILLPKTSVRTTVPGIEIPSTKYLRTLTLRVC